MALRRTKTNPSGLPMQRRNYLLPVDMIYQLRITSECTKLPEAAIVRQALKDYFNKHITQHHDCMSEVES